MSMEEVNEKFPLTKYKTWRSNQAEQGLPTAGGITADGAASRPASIRGVARASEEANKHTELATTQTVSTTAETDKEKEEKHGKPEVIRTDTADAQPSTPRPKTATSTDAPDTPVIQKVTSNDGEEEDDDHIQTAVPAEQLPDPGDTCAICIDTLEDDDDVRGLLCGHAFHASCVDPWLTSRRACCPLCKADYYVPKPRPEGDGTTPTAPQTAFMGDGRRRPTMVLPGRFMSIVYDERDRYGFPRVMRQETPAERRRRERREQRLRERHANGGTPDVPPNTATDGAEAGTEGQIQPQQHQQSGGWRSRLRIPRIRFNHGAANTLVASEGVMPSDEQRMNRAPEINDGSREPVTPAQLEAGQQGQSQAGRG